jgi:hypothetical protein
LWVFIPAHGDANWRLCARPSHKKEEKHWFACGCPQRALDVRSKLLEGTLDRGFRCGDMGFFGHRKLQSQVEVDLAHRRLPRGSPVALRCALSRCGVAATSHDDSEVAERRCSAADGPSRGRIRSGHTCRKRPGTERLRANVCRFGRSARACTHKQALPMQDKAMSALPSNSDIGIGRRHVCYGPRTDMGILRSIADITR